MHLLHAGAHAHAVMERHSKKSQSNNEDKKHHLSGRGEVLLVEHMQHYSAAEGTIDFHIWSTLTKETGLNLISAFQEESKLSRTITGKHAIPNLPGMSHLHFQWESLGSSGGQVCVLGSLCHSSYTIALSHKVPDLLAFSISKKVLPSKSIRQAQVSGIFS